MTANRTQKIVWIGAALVFLAAAGPELWAIAVRHEQAVTVGILGASALFLTWLDEG